MARVTRKRKPDPPATTPFAALTSLGIYKRDVLIARVIIHAYNHHVRLLSPEPLVFDKPKSTRVQGADIVMKSSGY